MRDLDNKIFIEREESFLKYFRDCLEKNNANYNLKIQDQRKYEKFCSLGIYIILEGNTINIKRSSSNIEIPNDCEIYNLSLSGVIFYVDIKINNVFKEIFKYYLTESETKKICTYDNLIHICFMVKNAGPKFRKYLELNLPYIDRWTILDTGSTDSTVEIIKDVLSCKEGKLYEEPFTNFRDSRNRCLDLAYEDGIYFGGNQGVYTIMLDDSYYLEGDTRGYLSTRRT